MVFRILGQFRSARECWKPQGGQRILVIAPHPDDEALGCGGTIARHVASGDSVHVLIVTDGRRSRAGDLDPEVMAETRKREARIAATMMNVRLTWLGQAEGDWSGNELEAEIREVVRDFAPDIVYGPCWLDYHPEHRRVAGCLARVISPQDVVRIYTLHVPLGRLTNVLVDVSEEMALIEKLFVAYETQTGSLMRGLRLRRYSAALNRCGTAAEEFSELSGDAYRQAHLQVSGEPVVRGIRYWSFSDPMSYLIGRNARRTFSPLLLRAIDH